MKRDKADFLFSPQRDESYRTSKASAQLWRAGLLADDPLSSAAAHLTTCQTATTAIDQTALRGPLWDLPRVLACKALAKQALARHPLKAIMARRRAQRLRWSRRAGDEAGLLKKAARFAAARPLVSGVDRCMSDSLALLFYLGKADAAADWVFGVTAPFFSAHCWVNVEAWLRSWRAYAVGAAPTVPLV
ncbi:lasso peptide biosynthesis B2 protein [Sphingosinicella microcystinivorans]|uniref:lasso peptide biosynthesis B2 protein n=1 Tax=Sphingosinicella microcystinivorans TaxID=335406 RepID=UPI0022F3A7A5|nr:lasso peptide biosynthesis B2 protein [Sphingosinicella microcystinivorans]WBX82846.1 lasso peptide biosynthesis B2 protein [Sphingosinicella microcystinivorans]